MKASENLAHPLGTCGHGAHMAWWEEHTELTLRVPNSGLYPE